MYSRRKISGSILPLTLVASAVVGLLAMSGLLMSTPASREAMMYIEPVNLTTKVGESFTVTVTVNSNLPVNAFAGKVVFDQNILAVKKIDYNTSIANLWTEEPWFNAGEGSLIFTGGTTQADGFIGTGPLVTITFTAIKPGSAKLWLLNPKILQHDGLGTEAPLSAPIDNVFTVVPEKLTAISIDTTSSVVAVNPTQDTTDLNQDGATTLRDMSIFMLYLATLDIRGDISGDGKINLTDASIMLDANHN